MSLELAARLAGPFRLVFKPALSLLTKSLRFRIGQRKSVAYVNDVLFSTSSSEATCYQLNDLLRLVSKSSPNFEERLV